MKKTLSSLVVAIMLLGSLSWSASAGGWASVDFISEVPEIVAGQPVTLEYVVRSHGMEGSELDGMHVTFGFVNDKDEGVEAIGEATADPKVYTVTFTLPSAGEWQATGVILEYNNYHHRMQTLNAVAKAGDSAIGAPVVSRVVKITDSGFEPATISIKPGDAVTWVNEGTMTHQVAPTYTEFATSPMLSPGEAYTVVFSEAGKLAYNCPPHPGMIGAITIEA